MISDVWLVLLLTVLGVYRISHMVAREDGPVDLFADFREKIGQGSWFGRGMNCVLCISFWLSIIPALVWFGENWVTFILGWFGISGSVLVIHKVLDERTS